MKFHLLFIFSLIACISHAQKEPERVQKLDSNEYYFEFDIKYVGKSVYPDPNYQYVIEHLVQVLKQNPAWTLTIRGHVCCGPSYRISKKRARNVYRILSQMGIAKERMTYRGESDHYPLAYPEKTDEDAAKNRRVDFIIKKN